jgi:hypothetical protein
MDSTTEAPAPIVVGMVTPLTLKISGACTDCDETLTDEVPVFLTVTEIVLLDPTATDPKLAEVGLNVRVPEAAAIWPGALPENATASNIMNTYTNSRRRMGHTSGWIEMVSGKTAEYRFWSCKARGPYNCMSLTGYGRANQRSTEQEQRLRASSYLDLSGRTYLSLGTG